jgi:hypothetical protein
MRYLLCALLVWAGLAVVSMLVGPTPHKQPAPDPETPAAPASTSAEDVAA